MKRNLLSLKTNSFAALTIAALIGSTFAGCKKNDKNEPGINKVNHVVVIYLENHSFDNLYGQFTGANGLSNATAANTTQVDATGNAYASLPAIPGTSAFPTNLANNYFNIDQYIPADQETPDVLHRYYQEQMQIDGGKMDKYAAYNSNSAGLSQGYYKTSLLPLLPMAQQYVLCDNFFHSAFGGSFLNHQWLIAAASPTFPNAPKAPNVVAQVDANGVVTSDGFVTPDGFVVNTSYSVNIPHPAASTNPSSSAYPANLIPNQTNPTIGDRLSDKNISWAWYSGGWNDAIAGHPDPTFQFHHQPFAYYAKYADGTQGKKDHLKDETEFIAAAKAGSLPAVSFIKPLGINNEHPGYAALATGENHTVELINDVLSGPNGKDAVIIITYDENGGFWDHVAPPAIDKKWGPGTRVPAIIISPFAKKGYVDHTQYETVGILSFIEKRWGLTPLADRDKNANPLTNAFNF
ncbi:alkaline phosphatase family protein [Mucilaginibacter sp. OK098]|uniref:alkaline phosphatase family protein n=1 Tax=Mucilaginibacter sp. OK098 TaxID=1855297 RepID=UPI000917C144|nr:alkaline phosphatase family protein [Mucilaginibacter sp. OK098]SHM83163.1 phospholipase C [Mucilaginibacter sp. OK098]